MRTLIGRSRTDRVPSFKPINHRCWKNGTYMDIMRAFSEREQSQKPSPPAQPSSERNSQSGVPRMSEIIAVYHIEGEAGLGHSESEMKALIKNMSRDQLERKVRRSARHPRPLSAHFNVEVAERMSVLEETESTGKDAEIQLKRMEAMNERQDARMFYLTIDAVNAGYTETTAVNKIKTLTLEQLQNARIQCSNMMKRTPCPLESFAASSKIRGAAIQKRHALEAAKVTSGNQCNDEQENRMQEMQERIDGETFFLTINGVEESMALSQKNVIKRIKSASVVEIESWKIRKNSLTSNAKARPLLSFSNFAIRGEANKRLREEKDRLAEAERRLEEEKLRAQAVVDAKKRLEGREVGQTVDYLVNATVAHFEVDDPAVELEAKENEEPIIMMTPLERDAAKQSVEALFDRESGDFGAKQKRKCTYLSDLSAYFRKRPVESTSCELKGYIGHLLQTIENVKAFNKMTKNTEDGEVVDVRISPQDKRDNRKVLEGYKKELRSHKSANAKMKYLVQNGVFGESEKAMLEGVSKTKDRKSDVYSVDDRSLVRIMEFYLEQKVRNRNKK